MKQWIRQGAHLAAALVFASLGAGALAQDYPTRPVTIIVPFAAGGPTDTIARIIAQRMGQSLGQTVVVENVTGAGGSIAVGKVVHAPADGYTVSIGHLGTHVITGAVQDLQYNALTDLDPVGMVAANPQIIVSKNDVPAKTLKEFVAWAKAKPAPLTSGTGGPGTPSHVSGIYFANTTGAKVDIIHYRGSGPALQDVMAGHIDATFDQAANALPQIRAGRIRAYAVTQSTRLASAPDIPTVDEAGLPKFYMTVWHALWVPKGTPAPVIAKLNQALRDTLADAEVRKKLGDLGQEIPPPEQQTPQYLHTFHKAEQDKWWPMIKAAGIKG
ncbi:MAG TPA: tripartite tricarboxylate transporter substrate-binding protein [Usitatibacter sp.]|jgi:tripartite-type tricarboxylate transporter receptor subunit TctC|nr:tripartite tricarboxylate transporter substrate-binding protein [Usitatibacter sp.]